MPKQSLIRDGGAHKGGLLGDRIAELYEALQPRSAVGRGAWAASAEAARVAAAEKERIRLEEAEQHRREREAKEAEERQARKKQDEERKAAGLQPLPPPRDPYPDVDDRW